MVESTKPEGGTVGCSGLVGPAERLRLLAVELTTDCEVTVKNWPTLFGEAADEIERLRGLLRRARVPIGHDDLPMLQPCPHCDKPIEVGTDQRARKSAFFDAPNKDSPERARSDVPKNR